MSVCEGIIISTCVAL